MPTKDELIDEVATLKQQLADLTAGVGDVATEQAPAQSAADMWVERAGLGVMVEPVQDAAGQNTGDTDIYLYGSDGMPANGVIVDGAFEAGVSMARKAQGSGHALDVEGVDTYTYDEVGKAFVRHADGEAFPLEKWQVDNGDGTHSDVVEGKRYVVVSSGVLRELQPGDESELAAKVEQLQHDLLMANTRADELREANAALNRRLAQPLHGSIDDLPAVV